MDFIFAHWWFLLTLGLVLSAGYFVFCLLFGVYPGIGGHDITILNPVLLFMIFWILFLVSVGIKGTGYLSHLKSLVM